MPRLSRKKIAALAEISKLPSIVANNIKRLKEEKNITFSKLGEFIGVKESYVRDMISGRRLFNLIQIEKICHALSYPIHLIFIEEEGDMVAEPPGPPSQYDRAFDETLEDPDVQMLLEDISDIPKKRRQEALKQLRHTVQFWKEESGK